MYRIPKTKQSINLDVEENGFFLRIALHSLTTATLLAPSLNHVLRDFFLYGMCEFAFQFGERDACMDEVRVHEWMQQKMVRN